MKGIVVRLLDIVGLIDRFIVGRGLIVVVSVGVDTLIHEVTGDGQSIARLNQQRYSRREEALDIGVRVVLGDGCALNVAASTVVRKAIAEIRGKRELTVRD